MKKWLISLVALTLTVAAATAVTFAVLGNGSGAGEESPPSGAGQPSDEVRHVYDLKVRFNTSVTQADIDEAQALLHTYDENPEFTIMESFPPIGRALVTTNVPDFCEAVDAELEDRSYADGVSCGRCLGSQCSPEAPPPGDVPASAAAEDEYCSDRETRTKLSYEEAVEVAQNSECVEQGQLKETRLCNQETGTWWIDLDLDKPGCSPACVVDVSEKTAEINWRCTGLLPPSPTASGAPRYEVTVHFNTLVTQDDIDEAAVLLGDGEQDVPIQDDAQRRPA